MDEWLPDLGGAELKVMLYLIRRTFGFHRQRVEVGLRVICNGVPGKDRGTGLHLETAAVAIKSLEAKGIVLTDRQPGGRTTYTLPVSSAVYGKSERSRSENPNTEVYGKSEHEERKVNTERKLKSSSPSPPSNELSTYPEEEEEQLYMSFKRWYPRNRFDEGNAKPFFERLSLAEQTRAIQRLQQYLVCPRWLHQDGQFIPFASNWLKSYDSDPPPLFIKASDDGVRKQVESISRVAELTRAYRSKMQ
jgi:hypothetical protein